jgi:hypothetical protein
MSSHDIRSFAVDLPPPELDESLLGFVTRCFSRTPIRKTIQALGLADIEKAKTESLPTSLDNPEAIRRLAGLLKTTETEIRKRQHLPGKLDNGKSIAIDFFGTMIRPAYRSYDVRRVSPRALKTSPHHRAIWDIRIFSFDPETREALLDECPNCKRKLTWRRAYGVHMCDRCLDADGFPNVDLRDFPQALVEVDDTEALDFVAGLVSPHSVAKEKALRKVNTAMWLDLSVSEAFEIVVALASALTIKADADRSKLLPRPKTDEEFRRLTPSVMAMAARAILDGKDGFSSIADKIRERAANRPGFYGVKKELLPLICAGTDAHLSGDTHRIIRAAIHDDMKRTGDGNPLRRRDYGLGQEYLGLHALSGITGLRPAALRRLADSGLVEVIAATDAKKSPKLMAAAEVVPLAEVYSDSLHQRSAAMQLSVPTTALPALEARDLIHRIDGPVTTLFESEETHYRRGEVEKFAAEIQSRILAHPGRIKVVRLSQAVKGLMMAPIPWGAVIAAIISGKAEIYRAPGHSRSWRTGTGVRDLQAFLDAVRSEVIAEDSEISGKWIGNQTVAEMLGLTTPAVSILGARGLLRRDGPADTLFDVDEVRSFRSRYIFIPEIEQRTGVLKRVVRRWLLDYGIEPEMSLEENKYMAYSRGVVEKVIASQAAAE